MIESFKQIGNETARSILSITDNPLISLFTGLLITAIIQSSSTTTSMIVAIVAAGSMNFENAIPMIMGANIGTTLTSTLISLSFMTKKPDFQRAFSAGVLHDLFNITMVVILFPLEYFFKFLSGLAYILSDLLKARSSKLFINGDYNLDLTSPLTDLVYGFISNPYISLFMGCILLFISIKVISNQISKTLISQNESKLDDGNIQNFWKPFGLGTLLTAGIQSSSITTSIIVPVAASGTVSLKNLFPFIIGANVGTTITALIAAFFISTDAITIAIVHVLFNLFGFILYLAMPQLRKFTLQLSEKLGELTLTYRLFGLYYILIVFFLIPFLLIYISK